MATTSSTAQLLAEVPAFQRGRIISGMRWTVWLAALAMPLSYGTSAILARTSPEAIGTYGLLTVYAGVVRAFFYLGGDTVVIRFVPEVMGGHRLSFLASYFLLACITSLPWLSAVILWPQVLHYVFGPGPKTSFCVLMLCLSPIHILFFMTVATLKGMLEIRWAQVLTREIAIGSFLFYASLYITARAFLSNYYTEIIWGVYTCLTLSGAILGLLRIIAIDGLPVSLRPLLPTGFWKYVFSSQQLAVLGFFMQRLDYVLVLSVGGLEVLGQYVAISTIAGLIPVVNGFFLETLLPALMNLLTCRNRAAAGRVFSAHMRILFAVNTATTCGLVLMAAPLIVVFGDKYFALAPLLVVMAVLMGLASPASVGGTLLSTADLQQVAAWLGLARVGLFAGSFLLLWPRWQLLGAIVAYGVSTLAANVLLVAVARRRTAVGASVAKDYLYSATVVSVAAGVTVFLRPGRLDVQFVSWFAAIGLYLLLGGYRASECLTLVRWFAPLRLRQGTPEL